VGISVPIVNNFGQLDPQRRDWFTYVGEVCNHINTSTGGTSVFECNGSLNPQCWGTATVGEYVAFIETTGGLTYYPVRYVYYYDKP